MCNCFSTSAWIHEVAPSCSFENWDSRCIDALPQGCDPPVRIIFILKHIHDVRFTLACFGAQSRPSRFAIHGCFDSCLLIAQFCHGVCRLPFERSHNSDNLKLLNQYVDKLATGANPPAISVSFWTRGDLQLELTDAVLDGSLGNLYLAFGLISEEEWAELRARNPTGVTGDDINLLQWLDETVRDAVATADEHEQRKKLVRELKATIEFRFGLAAVRVGKTYSSSSVDLARQLECLRVFEAFLTEQTSTEMFEGLAFELYHPWSAPSQTYQWTDGTAAKRMEAAVMKAHISSDGSMHLIADRSTIRGQIESLDRKHAKVLSSVNDFWLRRQRDLVPQLRRILGVQNVWCDNRSAESQEAFVLWAGRVLNAKAAFEEALERRSYSFSVLVHSDPASPLVDYVTTSSILQVCALFVLVVAVYVIIAFDKSYGQHTALISSLFN